MKDSDTDHPQELAAPNSHMRSDASAPVAQKSRERFESRGAAARDDDAVNGVEEVKKGDAAAQATAPPNVLADRSLMQQGHLASKDGTTSLRR